MATILKAEGRLILLRKLFFAGTIEHQLRPSFTDSRDISGWFAGNVTVTLLVDKNRKCSSSLMTQYFFMLGPPPLPPQKTVLFDCLVQWF